MKNRKQICWWVICSLMFIVGGCDSEDDRLKETEPDNIYVPFVKAGKVWGYGSSGRASGSTDMKEFLGGDTIISGKSYLKLYYQYIGRNDMNYEAALREQDRKVYCVLPLETKEWLAYDFGLTVGDEFGTSEVLPWLEWSGARIVNAVLNKIDFHEYEGVSCQRLCFDVYQDKPYAYCHSTIWIEGVGAQNFPVYEWMDYVTYDDPKGGPSGGFVLYYCEDNGKLLYKSHLWHND